MGNHPLGNGGWAQRDSVAEGKEGLDRDSMELRHEDLVQAVLAANPRTVVVLICSFPTTMDWTVNHVPAILHMTHSGQESGTALAGALFGDFNPGGKLTQTWPQSMAQLPPMMDYDIRHGRTYMYFKQKPLFPFGYGLSYTDFRFANLQVDAPKLKSDGSVTLSFDLSNQGQREGDEVVQLYVRYLDPKVERPLKQLRNFKRVTLNAGENQTVQFVLRGSDLAYWAEEKGGVFQGTWKVEPGKVEILVGASSEDIKLKDTVEVVE